MRQKVNAVAKGGGAVGFAYGGMKGLSNAAPMGTWGGKGSFGANALSFAGAAGGKAMSMMGQAASVGVNTLKERNPIYQGYVCGMSLLGKENSGQKGVSLEKSDTVKASAEGTNMGTSANVNTNTNANASTGTGLELGTGSTGTSTNTGVTSTTSPATGSSSANSFAVNAAQSKMSHSNQSTNSTSRETNTGANYLMPQNTGNAGNGNSLLPRKDKPVKKEHNKRD